MLRLKLFFLLFVSIIIFSLPTLSFSKKSTDIPDKTKLMLKAAKLQIPFIENQGQIKDRNIKFYANTFAGNVYVTGKGEIVYGLHSNQQSAVSSQQNVGTDLASAQLKPVTASFLPAGRQGSLHGDQKLKADSRVLMATLKETLIGTKSIKIKGNSRAITKVNYFVGDKKNWKSNIPAYEVVSLGEVYDNIELKLKAYGKNVEKLFTVKPGGKVENIKVKIEIPSIPPLIKGGMGGLLGEKWSKEKTRGIKVNSSGELEISTELGAVKFTKPYAYQEIEGKRLEVECKFEVQSSKSQVENPKPETLNLKLETSSHESRITSHGQRTTEYGFKVASYNPNYPLLIDPLLASTFIGPAGGPETTLYGDAIAIDSSGNVFVAGWTRATVYPTTLGAYDISHNGYFDVFVSKLNSSLTTLLSSTFIGGSPDQFCEAMAIDSSGNVFIAGFTSASNYPTTTGAYDTSFNGYIDVFVSKLNNNLSSLLSSTFIGGITADYSYSLSIDSSGNIFVTGETDSSGFPATTGAYDTSFNGYTDVFVSKLNNTLTTLLASTFIGGSASDYGYSIGKDSSENIFITGTTGSSDYPTTPGVYNTSNSPGSIDIFVSKLNNNLTSLLASTFIGNAYLTNDCVMTIDSSDNVFVTGMTASSAYPTTPSAYDTSHNGLLDVFISKMNNNLTSLLSSTFLGGSSSDYGKAIITDSSGNVYVTGYTYSSNYQTTSGAYDTSFNGGHDVFLSTLDNNLSSLLYSTFIGGSSPNGDYGYSITRDYSDNTFISGYTMSSNYPTTSGAYDTSYNGGYDPIAVLYYGDVFVSKFNISSEITTTTTTTTVTITTTSTTTTTIPPTLITLSSFNAELRGVKIILKWTTESEIDNLGFNILRSGAKNGNYVKINANLIPARGNATNGASYKFIDKKLESGKTYYYKLEDVDRNGTSTLHGPVEVKVNYKRKK